MDIVEKLVRYDTKISVLFCIFVILQIVIVALANPTQMMNDAVSYVRLAKHAYAVGSWYPTYKDIYSIYLFAPGYVNWLTAWFSLGFTEKAPMFFNIIFNGMIFVELYYLGIKLFNRSVARIAVILFVFSVTTYASILCLLTEQMYTALGGLALCLALTGDKKKMLLAGIILGLANWVRPLAILFILCIILLKAFKVANTNYLKQLFVGVIATALIIGSATYIHSGIFAFQSSTFGVNLLMSANDYAKGNTSSGGKIFNKGEIGYIEDETMTFKERDQYWRSLAYEWIEKNPEKYFGMIPVKIARLHGVDIGFLDTFTGRDGIIQSPTYMKSIIKEFPSLTLLQWVTLYNQLLYWVTMLLAVAGAVFMWKRRNKAALCLMALWLLGTMATLPFPCNSRYHYPYMMEAFLFAGIAWNILIQPKLKTCSLQREA